MAGDHDTAGQPAQGEELEQQASALARVTSASYCRAWNCANQAIRARDDPCLERFWSASVTAWQEWVDSFAKLAGLLWKPMTDRALRTRITRSYAQDLTQQFWADLTSWAVTENPVKFVKCLAGLDKAKSAVNYAFCALVFKALEWIERDRLGNPNNNPALRDLAIEAAAQSPGDVGDRLDAEEVRREIIAFASQSVEGQTFLLRLSGMEVKDIAVFFGISEGGVRTRLKRFRDDLKEVMKKRHGEAFMDLLANLADNPEDNPC